MNKSSSAILWVYPIVLIMALAVFGTGLFVAWKGQGWTLAAAGSVGLIGTLAAWPLALIARRQLDESVAAADAANAMFTERFEQFSVMLNLLSEQQLLSDRAKAVAYRAKDREALRQAIYEDLGRGDLDAAAALADDMESEFGLKGEAEHLRQQIQSRRDESSRRSVAEHVSIIDRHVAAEEWAAALKEADRAATILPNNEHAHALAADIENRRATYKAALLQSFRDSFDRGDNDTAVAVLAKLDHYLTSAEAEPLKEQAAKVYRTRMENLRTQVAVAVQDHKWPDAIRLGDAIIREFPNTTMAREMRETMETLRQRATDAQVELAAVN